MMQNSVLTYREQKEICDKRVLQLRAEVQQCLDIANLTSNPLEEGACYERILTLEEEIAKISDHLFYLKLQHQDAQPPKQ